MFSVQVLKDERIVIVAEQRPESTEEQVRLQLLSNLQVLESCVRGRRLLICHAVLNKLLTNCILMTTQ